MHREVPNEPLRNLTRPFAEVTTDFYHGSGNFRRQKVRTGISTACYAVHFHGGKQMSNADLLPSLLFKINQNQLALEAAIMELTLWVEQRGSGDVGENVRGALATITKNEEFINMTLAVLMTPE